RQPGRPLFRSTTLVRSDLFLAVDAKRDESFGGRPGVGDFFRGEFLELGVRDQHDEDVVAEHDARRSLVGELLVHLAADGLEERLGLLEVSHGKIDENIADHLGVSFSGLWAVRLPYEPRTREQSGSRHGQTEFFVSAPGGGRRSKIWLPRR